MVIVRSPADEATSTPSIYFEGDAVASASEWGNDERRSGRSDKVLETARDVLGDGVELARTCAARFSAGLDRLPDGVRAPDEVTLQLSITLDTEVGAVLAKASASAQFQVTLTWQRQEYEQEQRQDDHDAG